MSRLGVACAVALLVVYPLAARGDDGPPALRVEGPGLPALDALVAAVALRVELDSLRGAIVVRGSEGGMATVMYAGRERDLELGAPGSAQLRRLALVIADLVQEERALGPLTPAPGPPAPQRSPTPVVLPAVELVPDSPTATTLTTLEVAAMVYAGLGSELERPALGVGGDLSVSLTEELRAWAAAGLLWWPPASALSVSVARLALPVRAGLLWRPEPWEVRVGALVEPLWITADDGSAGASRLDLSVGASAALGYRLAAPVDVALWVGVDLIANPTTYSAYGVRAFTVDRVLIWAGVSVGLEFIP